MESSFTVDIPKVFCIPITDKCHLRCTFCFNNDERFNTADHMDINVFKDIVDWIISEGVEYVDLTPTVGEALLIPNLSEFLDYLDESEIKKYTLITSLAHKKIDVLRNRPKLKLEVSLYGGNREEYKKATGRDAYLLVRENILKISNEGINILKRFDTEITDPRLSIISRLEKVKLMDFSEDRGLTIRNGTEIKKCRFMNEPLLTPSGISLCCIDYDYSKFIIGRIGDDLKEVYKDIEKTIRDKELKCSTNCDWYTPWEGDYGLD